MSKVFIGGSRTISRLNAEVRDHLDDLLSRGFEIVIGDANGADKAVQTYLANKGYRNVILYCSGDKCRNNVGNWTVRHIQVSSGVRDFKFYSEKDKEMALESDHGLFLWDGASKGTLENIRRMVGAGKTSLVYLSSSRSFVTVIPNPFDDAINSAGVTGQSSLQTAPWPHRICGVITPNWYKKSGRPPDPDSPVRITSDGPEKGFSWPRKAQGHEAAAVMVQASVAL